ncbi:unnamed protein product [Parajaminaea phylloscopi]
MAKTKAAKQKATRPGPASSAPKKQVTPVTTPSDSVDTSVSSSSPADESSLADESQDDGARTPTGRSGSEACLRVLGDDKVGDELHRGANLDAATTINGASTSNVVVCVRVRPAPPSAAQPQPEPWRIAQGSATVEATEHHPSLAKRAPSSTSAMAASSSSSFLAERSTSAATSDPDTYKYTFDSVLPPTSSDLTALYNGHISPVVRGAVQGYNGTVFAYGQTGSGKTFTMSGAGAEKGIIGRAIDEVFNCVQADSSREFLLRVSYLEIYNESLRDLLVNLPSSSSFVSNMSASASASSTLSARPASPTKGGFSHQSSGGTSLRIQEHPASGRISIAGLREELVTTPSDITSLLERGQAARHQAATDWNERSSRSHCVATLTIESRTKEGGDGVRVSALNLIDLAGSERAATDQERRKEGAFINKSLLTLGSVISKLSAAASQPTAAAHIPYRDSKLTRLLQTSLSGNARVAVLLTLSPLPQHAAEGLSTLKFGRRCKMIKLSARRGEIDETDGANEALLKRYKREVERLRAKLDSGEIADAETRSGNEQMREMEEKRRVAASEVEGMARQKDELRAQMEHLTRLILTGKSVAELTSEQSDTGRPSTPSRPRGRVSEFGTPGTPTRAFSRPGSPRKRPVSGSMRSTSDALTSGPPGVMDSTVIDVPRPFAKEAELASLRRNLDNALEAKSRTEELLTKELESWQQRVAQLKDTLDKKELEAKAEQILHGQGTEARAKLEDEVRRLQGEVQRLTRTLTSREEDLEKLRGDTDRDIAQLRDEMSALKSELHSEQRQRAEAEDTLRKRPETDEETVQHEFDELVKSARTEEQSRQPSAVPDHVQRNIAETADDERKLKEGFESLAMKTDEVQQRLLAVEKREAAIAKAEKDVAAECQHEEEITTLRRELEQQCREVADLKDRQAAAKANSPLRDGHDLCLSMSPSRLRETLATDMTPPKATNSLARGGSVREYRRYRAPILSSPSMSPLSSNPSKMLPALALASKPGGSQPLALVEAALRNEREEVARLNEVIHGQRTLMSELERSVANWQAKMKEQQEIIRILMDNSSGLDAEATPPLQEGENAPLTPPRASMSKRTVSRSLRNTPLRANARDTNGATPPPLQRAPAPSTLSNDDFRKRRSAFLADSQGAHTQAKLRGGSAMPLGSSSPYYGAHRFNKPPTTNQGLGLTAPNSPTKGSGLWGTSTSGTGPDPLPLPSTLTPNTKRAQRRLTIEHELEALKKGTSPRVDERTRGLLVSPKKSGAAGQAEAAVDDDRRTARDWYI